MARRGLAPRVVMGLGLLRSAAVAVTLRRSGPEAGAAPAPAPAPAGIDPQHFMAEAYNTLRSSGDRIGGAAQQVLGVQGHLEDLKDDLATEYKRWTGKRRQLLARRDSLSADIQAQRAALLEQQTLQSLAERLQGDLQIAIQNTAKLNETRDQAREGRAKQQRKLRVDIDDLTREIQDAEVRRQLEMNATQQRVDLVLVQQRQVQEDTLNITKTIGTVKRDVAMHRTVSAQQQGMLLMNIMRLRRGILVVQKQLKDQAVVQLERDRLADQAREVVRQREALDSQRVNCTDKLRRMDEDIRSAQKAFAEDTIEFRRCQNIDAENQGLKEMVNRCSVARRADR